MLRKGLTRTALWCSIVIDEARDSHPHPRQARCRPPLHHRDPSWLLAPPPHPPSLRLRRLCSRYGPSRLGVDRQLSRRPQQADQPLQRTEAPRPTMVAQITKNSRPPWSASVNSTTSCFGRRATANPEPLMSRTLDSQLSFADLELSRLGVHLDPVLQGIDAFLGQHSDLVEQVRLD